MGVIIRQAAASDAPRWLELLKASLGEDYSDKQIYDLSWISSQLDPKGDVETWVAEANNRLQASLAFLPPVAPNSNPVANMGRHFNRPESYADGSAEALLGKMNELGTQRKQLIVSRVFASDNRLQILYENAGYVCVGFQPFKHMHRVREGVLFYVRASQSGLVTRLPISESLPQISELATVVLSNLGIPNPLSARDGVTGYPLQTEVKFHDATLDDFELWRLQAQSTNPPIEISGVFNLGIGYLRLAGNTPHRAILAQRDDKVVAGLAYYFDPQDRCVRLTDSFSQDDLSMGGLFQHAVKIAQDQLSAVYLEVDVLATAPRLLKSAEQVGFVPIAYLPAFFSKEGHYTDVVKLVKLNMVYSQENATFTAKARAIVEIIDHNFHDQKVGVAIINLLRGLPIFEGLGDGELRKIARLFTQKLYRPGEKIFNKGDSGNEAYVVMRGQVDIVLEEKGKPIATIGNGQIFGELAFLDGAARVAMAVASQASIVLVIQRSAFNVLAQREPHLGMMVMRNVAMELSNRLRRSNVAMASSRK